MYTIHTAVPVEIHEGHVDLSFRLPGGWNDLVYPNMTGGRIASLLLGDTTVGPFVALAYMPPTEEPLKRGTAHGHDSDNWRITLLGESHMGPATYGAGQFRFQRGGQPYGADDYAAGPEGGYHLVMFGDRRGFPIRPVKQELVRIIEQQNETAARALGIQLPDKYPADERGLVTSIGAPDKSGKVEGSFADSSSWRDLSPGVRAAAGIFGHRQAGPLLLLVHAEPGATAVPPCRFDTESLLMVVGGSCRIGEIGLRMGDVRLQESGVALGPVVSGDDGLFLFLLLADRRRTVGEFLGDPWLTAVHDLFKGLTDQLQTTV